MRVHSHLIRCLSCQRVEYEDGIRKEYTIDTLGVRMWHVSSTEYYELTEDSYGQLHAGDAYVVRWQYQIKQSGESALRSVRPCLLVASTQLAVVFSLHIAAAAPVAVEYPS